MRALFQCDRVGAGGETRRGEFHSLPPPSKDPRHWSCGASRGASSRLGQCTVKRQLHAMRRTGEAQCRALLAFSP